MSYNFIYIDQSNWYYPLLVVMTERFSKDERINLLEKKIDGLEAVITKHVEELRKKEKNKSTKGK